MLEDSRYKPLNKMTASSLQDIQVLVNMNPWKLLMNMRGVRLDSNHIAAALGRSDHSEQIDSRDQFIEMLKENQSYTLQTNFEDDEPDVDPIINAVLDTKRETASGWELIFKLAP